MEYSRHFPRTIHVYAVIGLKVCQFIENLLYNTYLHNVFFRDFRNTNYELN